MPVLKIRRFELFLREMTDLGGYMAIEAGTRSANTGKGVLLGST